VFLLTFEIPLTLDQGRKKAKHPYGRCFFSMVIKHVIASILTLQQLVLNEQDVALMMIFCFLMERGNPRNRMVWSYERPRGFMEQHLLGCFCNNVSPTQHEVKFNYFEVSMSNVNSCN
jgi:hypothetical protein